MDSEQSPVVLSCEGQERRGGERMAGVGGGVGGTMSHDTGGGSLTGIGIPSVSRRC